MNSLSVTSSQFWQMMISLYILFVKGLMLSDLIDKQRLNEGALSVSRLNYFLLHLLSKLRNGVLKQNKKELTDFVTKIC